VKATTFRADRKGDLWFLCWQASLGMWKLKMLFIEILALGARRALSLGAEMKYFFWTSVCFLVTWGALNLPGLLKYQKMWVKSLWEQDSISKNPFVSQKQSTWSHPASCQSCHPSPPRAGPRLAQVPPSAISPQRHEKAFPPWTHSLREFVWILEMSLVGCLNPDESILQILASTNSLFCDF